MAELAFSWEREAMKDLPMPEGLPPEEQRAYLALRQVYRDYRGKSATKEAAGQEKRLIIRSVADARAKREFQDRLTRHHSRILRETEAARTACRKNPTPENALRLCDVLDGLITEIGKEEIT